MPRVQGGHAWTFKRGHRNLNTEKRHNNPTFRRWGGCEYVRGNWREGGAGHIRRVICPRRLKRQSAQQIFTPFIRVWKKRLWETIELLNIAHKNLPHRAF